MPRRLMVIENILIPCHWYRFYNGYTRSRPTPASPTWPWACPGRPRGDSGCARISLGSRAGAHVAERSRSTRHTCHTISVHAKPYTGARTHAHRHNVQRETTSTQRYAQTMTQTIVAHLRSAPAPSSPIAAPTQKARRRAEKVWLMFTVCERRHKVAVAEAGAAVDRSTQRPGRVAAAQPGRPPRPTQRERGVAEPSCRRYMRKVGSRQCAQKRRSRCSAIDRFRPEARHGFTVDNRALGPIPLESSRQRASRELRETS